MAEIDDVLKENREAVDRMIAATDACGDRWNTHPAPGKWSPGQIVEHVARALEESANELAGRPSKLPRIPALLRPLIRGLVFNRVVRTGAFPKAKTNREMDPVRGPETPADGRSRLETAREALERESRARIAQQPRFTSTAFGTISVVDYIRFQQHHTLHHLKQMGVSR
jgi:peptidoglycan/xylan/chitin deacetylase (PgdA/CDA1 family)